MADDLQGGAPTFAPGAEHDIADRVVLEFSAAPSPAPAERREVNVVMGGEDLRTLIARCLLFTDRGRNAITILTRIRIDFSERWAVAYAADGYTLGVQKMRCEADGPGTLILDAYDAQRIAAIVPKAKPTEPVEDVRLSFVTGGAEQDRRPVNAVYEEAGRIGSYSCDNAYAGPPEIGGILNSVARYAEADAPRFAMQPDFLVRVAKASEVSKEQWPAIVRFYVAGDPPQKPGEGPTAGPLVARFHAHPDHDEFVAVLQPLVVTWGESDALARVVRGVRSQRGEPVRFRPLPTHLGDGAGA